MMQGAEGAINLSYTIKKRKILGTLTILGSVPSLWLAAFLLIFYKFSLMHWLFVEKMIIVLCCFIGGIFLWKGHRIGYLLSAVGWAFLIYVSLSSIVVAFDSEGSDRSRYLMLTKDLFYLAIGFPIFILLIYDMRAFYKKKMQSDKDHVSV